MKVVRFRIPGNSRLRTGVLDAGFIRPLSSDDPPAVALARGIEPSDLESDGIAAAEVRLESPVDLPPSLRDFISFEEHISNCVAALGKVVDPVWYEQPVFYFSNPAAVIGPEEQVAVAPGSNAFDYEIEVGAVIGNPGRDIAIADAETHIAGYTIFIDWSARDLQERESRVGLGPAKGKDTASTVGPFLVTLDELEHLRGANGYAVELTATVNGRPYSRGDWYHIRWSFAQMIAYASRGTTLRTGDVIGSGTVGTGCILELRALHGSGCFPYLVPGDVVEIHAGPLGSLRQTVVAGSELTPI